MSPAKFWQSPRSLNIAHSPHFAFHFSVRPFGVGFATSYLPQSATIRSWTFTAVTAPIFAMANRNDNDSGDDNDSDGLSNRTLCGAPFPPRPKAIATFLASIDFVPGCQTLLHSLKVTKGRQILFNIFSITSSAYSFSALLIWCFELLF